LVDLEANVFVAKLKEFTIFMKHQVLNVLHLFFSFLHKFDRKKIKMSKYISFDVGSKVQKYAHGD